MRRISGVGWLIVAAVLVFASGCQKSSNQPAAQNSTEQLSPTDTSAAAADGNLATPEQAAAPAAAPGNAVPAAPANPVNYQSDNSYNGDLNSEEEPPVYASQAPPPLPDYSQPECPGDNYMWTPGYWNYTTVGYYWVPGAWVIAPYVGALWTPPYWAFEGGRYRFHYGYWAPHIGFYGGIDYGFGYPGRGYYGGYWHDRTFEYNRAVNNVNVGVVHNVYTRNVTANNFNKTRISYNGGSGGVRVQPIAAELAVLHERRAAPVPAQIQHMREAANNRAQFVQENRGKPAVMAAGRPLATAYHAPAAAPESRATERPNARPAPNETPARNVRPEERPGVAVQPRPMERANPRPAPNVAPAHQRPEEQPGASPRAEVHRAPQGRPAPQPRMESHPAPQPRAPEHAAPAERPNQRTERPNPREDEHQH